MTLVPICFSSGVTASVARGWPPTMKVRSPLSDKQQQQQRPQQHRTLYITRNANQPTNRRLPEMQQAHPLEPGEGWTQPCAWPWPSALLLLESKLNQ